VNETSVEASDAQTRGVVLALVRLGAEESVLQALDAARREEVAAVWRGVRALDEEAQARTGETWRAEAASGLPHGLSGMHPSWIEEALAGERPEVIAALGKGSGASAALPTELAGALARLAFGKLAPLCESRGGVLAERLVGLELEGLLSEITRRGARTVGRSLAGAAPSLRARAMVAVGEPWAAEIAAGSSEEVTPEQRASALALANTAGAFGTRSAVERLSLIGLACLRADLQAESPGSCLRVAGRLPAPLGRVLAGW
jgi:hypothetical protein